MRDSASGVAQSPRIWSLWSCQDTVPPPTRVLMGPTWQDVQLLCRGSTDKSHAQLLKFPEGSPMERVGIDVPVFFPHTEGDNHYLLTKWPEANSLLGGDHGGCTGGGKDLGPKSIKLTRAGTLNPVCLQACVKKKAHTRPVPCPSTLRVRDWSKDLTTPWWSSWP